MNINQRNDLAPPKLFLDSALIIATLCSSNPDASPGYGLFKLGEAGLIHLYTSEDVLRETQGVLTELLGEAADKVKLLLAENLAMANISVTLPPSDSTISECYGITQYRPDAKILAAAIEQNCEVFVTYDREHLLKNPKIGPPNTRLVVITGGEAEAWAIDQIGVRSRLKAAQKRSRE